MSVPSRAGQVAIDFALLAPRRAQTLTVVCSRDTPFPAFAAAAARLRADRDSWAAALDAIAGYDRAGRVGSISIPCCTAWQAPRT